MKPHARPAASNSLRCPHFRATLRLTPRVGLAVLDAVLPDQDAVELVGGGPYRCAPRTVHSVTVPVLGRLEAPAAASIPLYPAVLTLGSTDSSPCTAHDA